MLKTNVLRLLEVAHVDYEAREYDEALVDGVSVANALHEDPAIVFKTLVTEGEKKHYYVFSIPVMDELDLKKAAKAVNEKAIEMIPQKELLPLTGYVHGGCSPIGLKKPFPVLIDSSAQRHQSIFVSAGKRGYQVGLKVDDLVQYLKASFAELTKSK